MRAKRQREYFKAFLLLALLGSGSACMSTATTRPGGSVVQGLSGIPNPFVRSEQAWGTLPEGRSWGAACAIHYAVNDTVWVADR